MKLVPTLVLLSIAGLGGTLFFTNPSEEDYADYISVVMADEAQAYLCETDALPGLFDALDNAIGNLCESTVDRALANQDVQALIGANTERQNRIFFSTYTTEAPFATYKSVGIFNRFFPYSQATVKD